MGASVLIFFRLLCYLAAGGLVSLALIPPGEVSRGFFRFSAALYAALIAAGVTVGSRGPVGVPALACFAAAGLTGAIVAVRAIPLSGAGRPALALAALTAVAGTLCDSALGADPASRALGGAAAVASAMLLGSVITAMVLGHWYLVMPALPPDPLLRLTRVYAGSVLARAASAAAIVGLHYAVSGGRPLARLLDSAGPLVGARLLFGLVAPGVLALMALPTVRVRDTQPATGMLYVACVLVLVGEGIAHYLAVRTGVPI
jgi:hypothetical protein